MSRQDHLYHSRTKVRRPELRDDFAGQDRITKSERDDSVLAGATARLNPAALTPRAVLHLQRFAGNRAVSQILAESANNKRTNDGVMPAQSPPTVVQRNGVKSGTDPLLDLADPAARGLVYGTSSTRKKTLGRLGIQDNALNLDRYRTIDVYNRETGINAVMDGGAAIGIFAVREALDAPIGSWSTHLPQASANLAADADLQAWIAHLRNNKQHHGLRDLAGGGDVATKKLRGTRFGKNLINKAHTKGTALTPYAISRWLRNSRTSATAPADLARRFPNPADVQDINKWIYSAFFRRTSKAGIDFTTGRGQKVHFNISGAPGWDPSQGLDKFNKKMKKGGLKKVKSDHGRLITASEYKYVKKGIKSGLIPAHLVNFYDEF